MVHCKLMIVDGGIISNQLLTLDINKAAAQ